MKKFFTLLSLVLLVWQTIQAQQNGDYRTKQTGNWESPTTWERFDGLNWVSTGNPDVSAGNISILHNVTVSIQGIPETDQITIKAFGSLTITSRLTVQDGPGDDLLIEAGGAVFLAGGTVSGTGNLLNNGNILVQGSGTIAINCTNNNALLFSQSYGGCCITGQLNLTDQATTGRIDNYGSMIISASGGVYDMNIVNGEIYNHTNAQIQANYNTKFDVSKFTNEGEFIVGVTGVNNAVCTIKSAQSATHSGCRFKSNGNSMQIVMQTNGTFTYAADCIIDANMHYSTGIHEIASTYYGAYDSRVSTTVNCVGTEINFPGNVFVDAGNFGGPAVKRIGGALLWPSGTISGGQLIINDTATAVLGLGQTSLGILNTTLVNNGIVQLSNNHGGCCASPELNMTNGSIENNGQFIFYPSTGGGIRNVTFSGGSFHNSSTGTIINNASAASPWGDNEIYLRNTSFSNEGTIQANGVSLNIFPTTNPVIHGNITVAAGSTIKLGIPSTTTTLAADAVINGAGTVYFFEGNHQVNTASYNVANTNIGQSYSAANVYFNAPSVALNYVYMLSGILGGTASKLIKDDMVFINGIITGGPISNTDTSVFHYGAGNPGLGQISTTFTNNGQISIAATYGGCCSQPVANLAGGGIINNGRMDVYGEGGIRSIIMENGTFVNNSTGIINSNMADYVPYGEPVFKLLPASFTNNGTINVLRNKIEIGSFTVGGIINVASNCLLRSTGPVTFNGTLIRNDGEIAAPINYQTSSTKIIQGNGNFNHPVTLNSAATLTPGNSPGILTISGNYIQDGAALTIEIGGTNAGTSHDKVVIAGTATLSGTLNATEINNFNPTSFTSIDILTAAAVTGTFSQVNLPPYWSVLYTSNKVTLQKFNIKTYYRDQDNDGFGNLTDTIHRYETTAPAGYTTDSTDCNDSNPAVNPAATEVCNGIDDNCDGIVDQIAMPGIILYMPLNGNANDQSTNALNGTIMGNVTATTDRFGHSNSAMQFPGNTASYIRVNDQPLLRPSSLTLAAWVKMDAQLGLTGFISKSINCYNDSWHFGSQGGYYSTWVSNSTNCGDFVQMTAPNTIGNWHHIAFTLDAVADVRKLYVDGQLVATGSFTSSIPYDGNPVLIGAAIENGNLDFPFLGSLDDVLIFNRAITATEINTLFTSSPILTLGTTYYADADGDGFGNPAVSTTIFCGTTLPAGYVLNNTDCNDANAALYPGIQPGTISGTTSVCQGNNSQFTSSGNTGGNWTSSNPLVASIDPVSGLISAGQAGTTTIAYNINTCDGMQSATQLLTVVAIPEVNTISNQTVVHGGTVSAISFSGTANRYSWTNNNSNIGLAASGTGNIPAFTAQNLTGSTSTATITVTPINDLFNSSCSGTPIQFTLTVSPAFTMNPVSNQIVCAQTVTSAIHFSSSLPDVSYRWTNNQPLIALAASGTGDIPAFLAQNAGTTNLIATITVTPSISDGNGGSMDGAPVTFSIQVNHRPQMTALNNIKACSESQVTIMPFGGAATSFAWTNDNSSIGLAANGTGDIPAFTATNPFLSSPVVANIQVRNFTNDGITCEGSSELFTITVMPKPIMNPIANREYCSGNLASVTFSGVAVTEYNWVSSSVMFGINPFGSGNLQPTAVQNNSTQPLVTTFTVTPRYINNLFTCDGASTSFTITVNPTPNLDEVTSQRVCSGQSTNDIHFYSSSTGTSFNWTNSDPSIGLPASGTGDIPAFVTTGSGNSQLSVQASLNGCLGTIRYFNITVDPVPVIAPVSNQTVCSNGSGGGMFISNQLFSWTNTNPSIGLAASGTSIGLLPIFAASNTSQVPITGTITVIALGNNPICNSAPVQFQITVNPTPILDPLSTQLFCSGSTTAPIDFTSSVPGATYTWTNNNPSIGLAASGTGSIPSFVASSTSNILDEEAHLWVIPTYTHNNVSCASAGRDFAIRVQPLPILNPIANKLVCNNSITSATFTSVNNLAGFSWTNSNPTIGIPISGTGYIGEFYAINTGTTPEIANITVTPIRNLYNNIYCQGQPQTFSITVFPIPTVDPVANQTVCNGNNTTAITFSGQVPGTVYEWTNDNPSIGLPASGTGNIASFTAVNNGTFDQVATIRVRPMIYLSGSQSCSNFLQSFTIQVKPNTSTPVITANGPTTFCIGGNVTLSTNIAGQWNVGGSGAPTLFVSSSGTYFLTNPGNGCGATVSNSIVVQVLNQQVPTVTLTASANPSCRLAPVTFTAAVSNITGTLTYEWFRGNASVTSNSNTYTLNNLSSGEQIRCRVSSNAACTAPAFSNTIQVSLLPTINAGTISGASMITLNAANIGYASNGVSGGTWSTDNPAVVSVNSTTGVVNPIATGSANIRYTVSNACGTSTATKLVTVVPNADIVGPDLICFVPNQTYVYSFNAQGIPVGGTYSSSNPAVATAAINTNHGSIRVSVLGPGTTTISYNLPNNGGSISKTITVVNNSEALQPIEGPRNLCRYAIMLYFVSNPADLPTFTYTRPSAYPSTGYNWSVPAFLQIVSGQGTNTLTVRLISDVITSSINRIYAMPINYCSSVTDPYFVDLKIWEDLPTPSPILASTNDLCGSLATNTPVRYTIGKVPDATYYEWTLPAGVTNVIHPNGTGINDTTILVSYPAGFQSGNITVMAQNGCNSPVRSLTVTSVLPATPGLISGPTNTCAFQLPAGNTATYTVPAVAGITYNWTVPSGISNLTGQGTNSISFKYPSGFTSGSISVTATNGCGTSSARTLNVNTLYPATPGIIDIIQEQACPNRVYSYAIASLPANSSSVFWEVPTGGTILLGQGTNKIYVGYANTSINGKVTVVAQSNCRNSPIRATGVKLPSCPPAFGKSMLEKTETTTLNPIHKIEVFPNPSANSFLIQINNGSASEPADIRLLNSQGKVLQQWHGFTGKQLRFGEALRPGSYLLECRIGGARQTLRLIKL